MTPSVQPTPGQTVEGLLDMRSAAKYWQLSCPICEIRSENLHTQRKK
jgi:hypothetical protein